MFCPWPPRLRLSLAAVACLATLLLLPTMLTAACIGDCNADGAVTVDELLLSVNIALGSAAATVCAAVDANGDGEVTINELLAAVNAALNGCPATVTPSRDASCDFNTNQHGNRHRDTHANGNAGTGSHYDVHLRHQRGPNR